MSFDDLLTQICDVSRFTEGLPDSYGNKVRTWGIVFPDERCRLVAGGGKEITQGEQVVIANYKLFIGDLALTEQDRVTIDSVTYEILLVEDKLGAVTSHHKECYLQAVR